VSFITLVSQWTVMRELYLKQTFLYLLPSLVITHTKFPLYKICETERPFVWWRGVKKLRTHSVHVLVIDGIFNNE